MNKLLDEFGFLFEELHILFSSSQHSAYISRHRAAIINERIKVICLTFSVMVLVWIPIDFLLLSTEVANQIVLLRFVASIMFVLLALSITKNNDSSYAYIRLMIMMLTPCLFYALSQNLVFGIDADGSSLILIGIYELLPFLIMAGLALFPLTIIEVLGTGFAIFLVLSISVIYSHHSIPSFYFSAAWMLLLILIADMLSAVIQLKYMSSLISRISRDTLTGAITRQAGQEIIDLHFQLSAEENNPFAVAFVDLDNFKLINDEYGHDAGDTALIGAVQTLKGMLRRGDQIIRWGGEEFLLVLLDAGIEGIPIIFGRIDRKWLGLRPDGTNLTASIGVAERINDNIEDCTQLIELADKRMYQAKEAGRAQVIFQ